MRNGKASSFLYFKSQELIPYIITFVIAPGYVLDDPGIESRWGRDFLHVSRPVLGSTQPPIQWVLGISRV